MGIMQLMYLQGMNTKMNKVFRCAFVELAPYKCTQEYCI